MLLCRRGSATGIGLAMSTKPFCASVRVFRPGPIDLGFPVTQVIYAVTAHKPGVIRIAGCDISYGVGARTQHVGAAFIDHVHRSH